MPSEALTVRPAGPDDLSAVADLFLASRAAAVPQMPPVVDEADARRWVLGWDLGPREVWLAVARTGVVGFAALEDSWLWGLYVAPDRMRDGVGSTLLEVVKAQRPRGFALWVFESNERARVFYRRHGLVELEHTDGADNMEGVRTCGWPGPAPTRSRTSAARSTMSTRSWPCFSVAARR